MSSSREVTLEFLLEEISKHTHSSTVKDPNMQMAPTRNFYSSTYLPIYPPVVIHFYITNVD